METAKISLNGGSPTVQLPYSCRLSGDEVYARRIGEAVILCPKTQRWKALLESLDYYTDDFMKDGRNESSFDLREDY